jgi:hypothetical protein
MPKEFRPGFMYIKSNELRQEIAFSLKSGWVYCEEKGPDEKFINYSPEEIQMLNADGTGMITLGVHLVKKVFGGRIVQYDGPGPDNNGKSDEGKKLDSIANDTNTGGKIPETAGNSPNFRQRELEIY